MDLLQRAGVVTDQGREGDFAEGSRGQRPRRLHAVFPLGEIDPSFGSHKVIVAYLKDGKRLDARTGFPRIIAPGDKEGGRHVSALQWVRVVEVR